MALAFGIAGAPTPAQAVLITQSYDFTASGFGPGAPQDPVAGSFTVSVDSTGGLQNDLVPDAVSLTIAGFTYTVANTAVDFDSTNESLIFGGTLNTNTVVSSGTDDFILTIDSALTAPTFGVFIYSSSGTTIFFSSQGSVSFSAATVPEPTTLVLLGVALAGLGFSRRKARGALGSTAKSPLRAAT